MKVKPVYKSEEGKKSILEIYDSLLEIWPVPYEELNIDTRCGRTYIIACGEKSAAPLILLHGTSSNSSMWIGDVAEYSKKYRVYAVDIPGEPGKSEENQFLLNSDAYAEWMEDVFQGLKLQKASLAGISLGGWMAVKYAVKHPENVEKLVLISPSGIGPQKISFMLKVIPLMFLGQKGYEITARIVSGNHPIPEKALKYTILIAKNFNLRFEPVPIFTNEELRKLTMPTVLFAGKKDVILHSEKTAERLEKLLLNVKINVLPEAGHILINLQDEIMSFLL